MLKIIKKIWSIDWGVISRKNWAEKERSKYQKKNKNDYEFLDRKLNWYQGKNINELIQNGDMEKIGKSSRGHKLNLKVIKNAIRIFGVLEEDHSIFHPLLFLVKKTNKVTKDDLETFEERIKIYEK
jgi:hypothetical protein